VGEEPICVGDGEKIGVIEGSTLGEGSGVADGLARIVSMRVGEGGRGVDEPTGVDMAEAVAEGTISGCVGCGGGGPVKVRNGRGVTVGTGVSKLLIIVERSSGASSG
jgi:hypothetical protein